MIAQELKMSRKQLVVNHQLHPEMLESGQQLAAAGTRGSRRDDVTLSALDHARLVVTGKVSVIEVEETQPETPAAETPAPAKTKRT